MFTACHHRYPYMFGTGELLESSWKSIPIVLAALRNFGSLLEAPGGLHRVTLQDMGKF